MRSLLGTLPFALLVAAACGNPPAPTPVEASPTPAPEAKITPPAKAAEAKPKPQRPSKREPTFAAQLAAVDRRIAGHTKVAENNPRSALAWGRAAELYLTRARLSGSYDDYAKAEELLAKGFEAGKEHEFGPFMARARLHFTLHRLDVAEADFKRATVLPAQDDNERYARDLFTANLASQRGQYAEAEALLVALVERRETVPALSSLAYHRWKQGRFDEAETLYRRALAIYEGNETEPEAWIHLQLGLMDLDRGRFGDALVHYREAEALIGGYWLIEEHIAEILTLQGKPEEAKAMYLGIVERTGNPEFMDALAELDRAAGRIAEADQWLAKANAAFEAQLGRFPEAAYGHALEHYLAHGDDPAKALGMARRNHALRSNVDAKRLLAEALLAAGENAEAKGVIEEALATPMRSADLHATAAAVYAATGDAAKAKVQRDAALAINPKLELP
jgi:Tfp pilus assembly protein PilF